MNKLLKVIFFSSLLLVLLSSSVYSLTWDNVLRYDGNKITITDNLGLGGELAEVELVYNDDTCFSECVAIWDVTIYQDEDDFLSLIEFENTQSFKKNIEHKFEYVTGYNEIEVDDYGRSCSPVIGSKNNSETCTQIKTGSHIVMEEVWSSFNVKGKLPVGNYIIRLTGYKDWGESIDWIPTFYGKKVSEWAWWHSPAPFLYYKFDEAVNCSTPIDTTGNTTAFVTGCLNYTTGKLGNAMTWTGSESRNNAHIKQDFQTPEWQGNFTEGANFTIAFWLKSNNAATDLGTNSLNAQYIMSRGQFNDLSLGGWFVYLNNTKGLVFAMKSSEDVEQWVNTSIIATSTWQRVVITRDGNTEVNALKIYADNTLSNQINLPQSFNLTASTIGTHNFTVGNVDQELNSYGLNQTSLDDLVIYMDDWSAADVTEDWNGGAGLTSDVSEIALTINLDLPADNLESASSVINFTGRNLVTGGNFTNTTVYIWNSDGGVFDTNTSVIRGTTNSTNLTNVNPFINSDIYKWNIYTCAENITSVSCAFAAANRTIDWGLIVDKEYFNTSVYETINQQVHFNVTVGEPVASANLYYDGISYASTVINITGMSYKLSNNFNTPLVGSSFLNDTNRELFYQIIYSSGATKNTTTRYQNVSFINFQLCNATWTTKYLNISFIDESTSAHINGTIAASSWVYYLSSASVNRTLDYSTTTNFSNYAFCFNPSSHSVKTVIERIQYSLNGYPQRRYELAETPFTSTRTDTTLFLLAAGKGIYSTYSVQTSAGVAILDVKVTAERQVGGAWFLIESGFTDSAGAVTFWLNPDYDHRITATKTQYVPFQGTIRPSASTYTIILGTSTSDVVFESDLEGIKWSYAPRVGRLSKNQSYKFQFNITTSKENIIGCKMELTNISGSVLNSTTAGCGAGGGNLSFWRNMSDGTRFYGKFYVDVGGGFIILVALLATGILSKIIGPPMFALFDMIYRLFGL